MTDNLEASDHSEIEVLSQNLRGGTEEDQGKLIQDSRCPGRDSNQNPILRSKSCPPSLFNLSNWQLRQIRH